jgi:hypothetical protein
MVRLVGCAGGGDGDDDDNDIGDKIVGGWSSHRRSHKGSIDRTGP